MGEPSLRATRRLEGLHAVEVLLILRPDQDSEAEVGRRGGDREIVGGDAFAAPLERREMVSAMPAPNSTTGAGARRASIFA
jgi:hypothetical protein